MLAVMLAVIMAVMIDVLLLLLLLLLMMMMMMMMMFAVTSRPGNALYPQTLCLPPYPYSHTHSHCSPPHHHHEDHRISAEMYIHANQTDSSTHTHFASPYMQCEARDTAARLCEMGSGGCCTAM
jgi:hypothetical protein